MEKNLGHATAYGYAKSKGYSGTEDEFARLMADYASVGQSAAESAEQAAASATSASGSAATASQAAQTATSKASEAVTAAGTATTKASEASTSADTASTAAQTATDKASEATTAASTATTKASEASESATTATAAKTDAETARDAAAQSASEAAASAESIDPDEFNRKIYAAFATDTATGVIASLPDGADSIPMKDVLVHIEPVQEGSGDPSPENVRTITGWTAAKVTRTGRNLFSNTPGRDGQGTIYFSVDSTTKKLDINGTSSSTTYTGGGITQQNARYSLRAGTYTISVDQFPTNTTGSYLNMEMFAADGTKTQKTIFGNSANRYLTFTIDSDVVFDWWMAIASGTYDHFLCGIQLEVGSTATDYEPYSGQTYDITFPAEAGTVYGGTLDVTTGELVVDRAMVDLGTLIWVWNDANGWIASFPGIKQMISNDYSMDAICSTMPVVSKAESYAMVSAGTNEDTIAATWQGTYLYGTNANAHPTGILCYALATPITYHFTPQEITSLLGTNNLWADTGGSEVEYRANTKMYITKKITEAVSALS